MLSGGFLRVGSLFQGVYRIFKKFWYRNGIHCSNRPWTSLLATYRNAVLHVLQGEVTTVYWAVSASASSTGGGIWWNKIFVHTQLLWRLLCCHLCVLCLRVLVDAEVINMIICPVMHRSTTWMSMTLDGGKCKVITHICFEEFLKRHHSEMRCDSSP